GSERWHAIQLIFGPAVEDSHVVALNVAGLTQRLAKGTEPCGISLGRLSSKQADYWHCRLLRARRERPCRRSTTHQSYEFPSPHRAPQAEDHSVPHRERCCAPQQIGATNVRFVPKADILHCSNRDLLGEVLTNFCQQLAWAERL